MFEAELAKMYGFCLLVAAFIAGVTILKRAADWGAKKRAMLVGVMAVVALPGLGWFSHDYTKNHRYDGYEQYIEVIGHDAILAQEASRRDEGTRTYAGSLEDLLAFDMGLTDDPLITFVFGSANANGYTFTVRFAKAPENVALTFTEKQGHEYFKTK
ncbi:MAG: hypothetical protein M5R36_04090 [Deltaproteobacteria bacterium]|nr:hypothetical protein [Deltaproteobacteria bacterium]